MFNYFRACKTEVTVENIIKLLLVEQRHHIVSSFGARAVGFHYQPRREVTGERELKAWGSEVGVRDTVDRPV